MVHAVAKVLKDHGRSIVIAESPDVPPYSKRATRKLHDASGLTGVAEELGIELSYDTGCKEDSAPHGKLIRIFQMISPALEVDSEVSISRPSPTFKREKNHNDFIIADFKKPSLWAGRADGSLMSLVGLV